MCIRDRIYIHDIRTRTSTMVTDGSAPVASEIEMGSIYPTTAAGKHIRTCVACVATRGAWCGVSRVEGVSPYVGIRIGGIGWNYGGPMIG